MHDLLLLLMRRVTVALTWPSGVDWVVTGVLLLAAAVVLSIYGRCTGFLCVAPPVPGTRRRRIWATVWFAPALVEEVLFRVFPLPHPSEGMSLLQVGIAAAIALAAFVAAHPLRTWVKPLTRNQVFTDSRFLVLAALLGAMCQAAYLVTGSVWPPVVLHYVCVGVWLTCWGGWQKVTPPAP